MVGIGREKICEINIISFCIGEDTQQLRMVGGDSKWYQQESGLHQE